MIALLAWTLRALRWRLVGVWERRGMQRQPPPPPPPPRIVVVAVEAQDVASHPDPHTATLRERFATGAVPDGRAGPLLYHEYARIARAVRAEHGEKTT